MFEKVFLSVVIPAYNEEMNISDTLGDIKGYLDGKDFTYEVIVIDDGSGDDTVMKARRFRDKLDNLNVIESRPNRGKGYVLKKAIMEARGDYILFMDADNSTSIREMDSFLPLFEKGFDIYIASRRIPGARVSMPASREVMGKVYITLARMLLGVKVSDVNCGFKVFRREAAREVFSRQTMDDWSFDAEVLHIAGKRKYSIREVPVRWVYKDTSKVRPLADALKSFKSLFAIRMKDLKGIYG